jgi:hypothetical protein
MMRVCVFVCVCEPTIHPYHTLTHTHTHTVLKKTYSVMMSRVRKQQKQEVRV